MIVKKVNKTGLYRKIISLYCVLFSGYSYSLCPSKIDIESIVAAYYAGANSQNNFLSTVRHCASPQSKLNEQIDDSTVSLFERINTFNKEDQQNLVNFNLKVLYINAQNGYAPSEHNYAALHNAEPNSTLSKLVPQDQHIFIYWTKKSATQKEPRALFNLAIRMMNKTEGVKYDPSTSYIIFTYLKQHERKYYQVYDMDSSRQKSISIIGKSNAEKLNKNVDSFNFQTLAP